ncbi:MAG: hypothetical protein KBT87_02690 [Gammaproteobacteria bacterium]|jgi:hypothetical protein|nr:hypothetical protein [Gammaproteobacteria bacterium]MBQ0773558.1 hypothetical protein [Gammaproteobacteria bacterium]
MTSNEPTALLQAMTRRRFLRWLLYSAAAASTCGVVAFAWMKRSPLDQVAVPVGQQSLSAAEYHLFRRAAAVLLPTEGRVFAPLAQIPVLENIDSMLALLAPAVRDELSIGLALFDHGALVSGWHGKRFVDLNNAQALDYFDRWATGNTIQRTLATVVKKMVYVAYWRDANTWPAIEFDGPVSDRWGLASLGNAPLPTDQEKRS